MQDTCKLSATALGSADVGYDTAHQLPVLSWGEKALKEERVVLRINQGREMGCWLKPEVCKCTLVGNRHTGLSWHCRAERGGPGGFVPLGGCDPRGSGLCWPCRQEDCFLQNELLQRIRGNKALFVSGSVQRALSPATWTSIAGWRHPRDVLQSPAPKGCRCNPNQSWVTLTTTC